jgi:hypothetical protein
LIDAAAPGHATVPGTPPIRTLSVVIPALDEASGIAEILRRTLAQRSRLLEAGVTLTEVVVVDDGSRDRTAEIAAGVPGVEVIRHDHNRGYGAALKTGLARASGELLAFFDADGTYPPESLPELCRAALEADLVIGSRMAGTASRMPAVRRLGNRLFARLVGWLGDRPVTDSASGMRVLRPAVLERLSPLPPGLNFTPVMTLRALQEGLELREVPIPYDERIGSSKLSVARDGLRFLSSLLWTTLGHNPVRVLGAAGLAGVAVAGAVGCGLAVARWQGVTELGPWGVAAIFAALVGGVAGVSLFALGATFNYLVSLFRREPVRKGLFGRPVFDPPLDRQFGWMGLTAFALGLAVAAATLALGVGGWPVERLWLYLAGSALLLLAGLQLFLYWIVMRILEELSERAQGERHDSLLVETRQP